MENREIARQQAEIFAEMQGKLATFTRYSTVLLLDTSSSMYGAKIEDAKIALINFIKATNLNENEIAISSFGISIELSDLSHNATYLEKYVKALYAAGDTPMLAAMEKAYEQYLKRKLNSAMVLATDGQPNEAKTDILKYAAQLKAKGVRIITIAIGEDADKAFLKEMAFSSKDNYFAKESKELSEVFDRIKVSLALPAKETKF